MPIRCVAFDADDTLWDFTAAMRGGLARAIEVSMGHDACAAAPPTPEELVAAFEARYAAHLGRTGPGEHISACRVGSFDDVVAARGIDAAARDPLVASMAEAYFEHRHGQIQLFPEVVAALDELEGRYVVALVTNGNTDADRGGLSGRFAFRLPADEIGLRKPDPRIFEVAAAAAGCRTSELAYVGDDLDKDVAAPQAAGARGIWVDRSGGPLPARVASGEVIPDAIVASLAELPAVLARFDEEEAQAAGIVGVGPHPRPWPADDRLDPALLAVGDRRNVVDRYRYWREQAIVADLDQRRHPVHVAIENWRHDLNIGTVVRNANAFNVAGVHIVGQRRWNRRGAMATDRYLHVHHHATVAELVTWAASAGLCLVGIDNVAGAVDLDAAPLPERCTLVLGQEGPGLSEEVLDRCQEVRSIGQHGSTRSLNAGVASGIALHAWARDHASGTATWPEPPVVS